MDPVTLGLLALGAYMLLRPKPSKSRRASSRRYEESNRFRYAKRNGEWRAYFNHTPPSYHHVLSDGEGYYVCWDRPLHSKQDAQRVARYWVDRFC